MEFVHKSVLLQECIDGLDIKPNGLYVDATLGGGGHSLEIVKRLNNGHLYGIDQDEEALLASKARLSDYLDRVDFIHSNFENIKQVLALRGITEVDGILADLGVSSYQLDNEERGFSYMRDARLDMRMDKSSSLSAYDIVNGYKKRELARVIASLGEEKFAQNIAKHIVAQREKKPICSTLELVKVIENAIPMKLRVKGSHPAKKTFQAIRIELNRELEVLKNALSDMVDILKPRGRLCVITFHSLEDRIVKRFIKECEVTCICPPQSIICTCNTVRLGKSITRKPIIASELERTENSRSKSAKLRIFEKE